MSEETTRTPEQIQADIERTRAEVGDTVEQLAAKTDVKARAHERVEEIKGNVRQTAEELKSKATASTPDSAQQGGKQAVQTVRSNPAPFAFAGAVLLGYLIGRGRRG
jgi:uncharacterized protein YdbL (DUF1318 family)